MIGYSIGAIAGLGLSLFGARSTNKAVVENYKAQMRVAMRNYNYNQLQLDKQSQSVYAEAMQNLQNMRINSMQNNSVVTAALNETGYEGRTKGKISQSVESQTLRQEQALKDSTEVDILNLRSQKEALYIQTDQMMQNARQQAQSNLVSGSQAFVGAIQGALQGASLGGMAGAGIGALSEASSLASPSYSWGQAFTDSFSKRYDANIGLFTALNSASSGFGLVYNR